MFDHLERLKESGNFLIMRNTNFVDNCNVPENVKGVFIVYELARSGIEMVYIGHSGENDLRSHLLDTANGGLSIGQKIDEIKKVSQSAGLDIYWYVCPEGNAKSTPKIMGEKALAMFLSLNLRMPKWNRMIDAK